MLFMLTESDAPGASHEPARRYHGSLLAPTPLQSIYGASKAGQAAFSEALRGEVAARGVHVLTVYPGL
jgi:NAD(P)-dependent dehydrogenase (short-subunit alcohol dehydrogenase family)